MENDFQSMRLLACWPVMVMTLSAEVMVAVVLLPPVGRA